MQMQPPSFKSKRPLSRTIFASIVGILLLGLLTAGAAIYNELVVRAFYWIAGFLGPFLLRPLVIVVVVMLIGYVVTLLFFLNAYRTKQHAFITMNNVVQLDGSLLRLLASWVTTKDHEEEMKRILAEVLHDASVEFNGDVQKGALFLPDANDKEYLTIWTHFDMPQESVEHSRFYIGNDRSKAATGRGIAGMAYQQAKIHIAHMHRLDNGAWVCDKEGYIPSHRGNQRSTPHYHSFACIPVVGIHPMQANGTTTCWGVITFESSQKETFDGEYVETVLHLFAERVAATLIIRELFLNPTP